MALVSCPECGKEVSTTAVACPSCGYIAPRVAPTRKKGGNGCFLVAMLVGLVGVGVAIFAGQQPPPGSEAQETEHASASTVPGLGADPNFPNLIVELPKSAAVPPASTRTSAWNPTDPDQERTRVVFNLKFAQKFRAGWTLADLQRAAGSQGKITERHMDGDDPTVSYHWISTIDGYLLAVVHPTGEVGAGIVTKDGIQIAFNTRGEFMCVPASCRRTQ